MTWVKKEADESDMFHISSIHYIIQFIKKHQQMQFGFMNVILLHSDHWHVSATQVVIFRVLSVTSEKSTVQIIPSLNNLE